MAFEDEYKFSFVTTVARVNEYTASSDVFQALLLEVKELSKKKPDAVMSPSKVKIINKVLENLLEVLSHQPESKYLERLDDDDLPQVSDAVLMMVQFRSALDKFKNRHFRKVDRSVKWVTEELIEELRAGFEG